jgi:hypothetical protein
VLLTDSQAFLISNHDVRPIKLAGVTSIDAKRWARWPEHWKGFGRGLGPVTGQLTVVFVSGQTETWRIYPARRTAEFAAWMRTKVSN